MAENPNNPPGIDFPEDEYSYDKNSFASLNDLYQNIGDYLNALSNKTGHLQEAQILEKQSLLLMHETLGQLLTDWSQDPVKKDLNIDLSKEKNMIIAGMIRQLPEFNGNDDLEELIGDLKHIYSEECEMKEEALQAFRDYSAKKKTLKFIEKNRVSAQDSQTPLNNHDNDDDIDEYFDENSFYDVEQIYSAVKYRVIQAAMTEEQGASTSIGLLEKKALLTIYETLGQVLNEWQKLIDKDAVDNNFHQKKNNIIVGMLQQLPVLDENLETQALINELNEYYDDVVENKNQAVESYQGFSDQKEVLSKINISEHSPVTQAMSKGENTSSNDGAEKIILENNSQEQVVFEESVPTQDIVNNNDETEADQDNLSNISQENMNQNDNLNNDSPKEMSELHRFHDRNIRLLDLLAPILETDQGQPVLKNYDGKSFKKQFNEEYADQVSSDKVEYVDVINKLLYRMFLSSLMFYQKNDFDIESLEKQNKYILNNIDQPEFVTEMRFYSADEMMRVIQGMRYTFDDIQTDQENIFTNEVLDGLLEYLEDNDYSADASFQEEYEAFAEFLQHDFNSKILEQEYPDILHLFNEAILDQIGEEVPDRALDNESELQSEVSSQNKTPPPMPSRENRGTLFSKRDEKAAENQEETEQQERLSSVLQSGAEHRESVMEDFSVIISALENNSAADEVDIDDLINQGFSQQSNQPSRPNSASFIEHSGATLNVNRGQSQAQAGLEVAIKFPATEATYPGDTDNEAGSQLTQAAFDVALQRLKENPDVSNIQDVKLVNNKRYVDFELSYAAKDEEDILTAVAKLEEVDESHVKYTVESEDLNAYIAMAEEAVKLSLLSQSETEPLVFDIDGVGRGEALLAEALKQVCKTHENEFKLKPVINVNNHEHQSISPSRQMR